MLTISLPPGLVTAGGGDQSGGNAVDGRYSSPRLLGSIPVSAGSSSPVLGSQPLVVSPATSCPIGAVMTRRPSRRYHTRPTKPGCPSQTIGKLLRPSQTFI